MKISSERAAYSKTVSSGEPITSSYLLDLVRSIKASFPKLSIAHATFKFLGRDIHHFQSIIEVDGKQYPGHGRAPTQEVALVKSLCEALERRVMFRTYERMTYIETSVNALRSSGELIPLSQALITPPTKGFQSSNGWAAGTTEEMAQKHALLESLERHFLQLGFWKYGWNFLAKKHEQVEGRYRLHIFEVPGLPSNLSITVVAAENPAYPGLSFGHQARFVEASDWRHSAIEAIQAAEGLMLSENSTDIDIVQRQFLMDSDCKGMLDRKLSESTVPHFEMPDRVFAQTTDIAKEFNLPISLFATWVCSEEVLPLTILSRLSEEERAQITRLCEAFDCTPNEQSPFV